MFKDLYKHANDKIPTDDAYLRVMGKMNTKSQKTKYKYARIVALAACFLLTVSMISVYETFAPKEEVPFEVIRPENLPESTPFTPTATPSPESNPKILTAEEKADPVEVVQKPEAVSETQEPGLIAETNVPEAASQIQEPSAYSTQEPEEVLFEETPAPQNSFIKNQGVPENIGTAVARFTLGDTVTKDTYYEYLGKNIEESLVLPDGFLNETPEEHNLCLEENENFDDRWTFYFTKEDSSIFITTTKNTENVLNIINNENFQKSNVSGVLACLFEEDLQKIACIEVSGIGYTLSSYGVSDEDFENLITSLVK